ncbi:MAG: TRAP transporter large permease [Candidatus Odyssella sp.]|nr:TRAP transporter large permease [Candidatus Odyssella sp.]
MIAAGLGFAALFGLLAIGVPLGFAMAVVGFVGFGLLVSFQAASYSIGQIVFDNVMNYGFSVLPLFILMGNFVARSRLAEELFAAAEAFVGHRRGGLAQATILACGGFSSVCGSSVATAATMVKIALPPMRKRGYADSLATASIAAGGTLGILIPPSTVMVIYGILTGTDIGKLFAAGIIPGAVAVALLLGAVSLATLRRPEIGPSGPRRSWPERLGALRKTWGIVALFALVMGGIYFGIFTATEAAGIGAAGAFLFVILRRLLDFAMLKRTLIETARTTAMMFVILFGALAFSNFIEAAGLPTALSRWIAGLDVPPLVVILVIVAIYLVLGCALESISMVLLTVPIFFPIVTGLKYDPIWFGILVVVVTEISMITPPVGLNIFVINAMAPEVPTGAVIRGLVPFVGAEIALVLVLLAVPGLATWLPSLMR